MENYKSILKNHLPAVICLGIVVLCVFYFWLTGYLSEKSFEGEIGKNQTTAQTAVSEAANATAAAANSEVERRTEDAVREQVIVPKLETARRKSANSKISLEKARQKYSDDKITHENISSSRTDNCRKLAELYPGTRFEYCAESDTGAGSLANN